MKSRRYRPGAGRWPFALGAVILGALVIADRAGWLLAGPDDMSQYHGRHVRVGRVIDGDTLEIAVPDPVHGRPTTRVRLWGIDAPEPTGRDRPAEALAGEAAALAALLVEGGDVTLSLESHRTRGSFGRVLAHVTLADGSSLNEALLSAGFARVDERWPHSLLGRYAQVERVARRQKIGIWAEGQP